MKTETLPARHTHSVRQQDYTVPGGVNYYQETRYPTTLNETVQVQLRQAEPVYRTNEAIYRKAQRSQNEREVVEQTVHRIPNYQTYGVKVPVTHVVPVYEDIPVPVMVPEVSYDSDENMIENVRHITIQLTNSSSSESSESQETCANCRYNRLRHTHRFAERRRKLDQAALWY